MNGPPATRPSPTDQAINLGNRLPLLADSYDVRTSDGQFVCRATREEAERAITAGVVDGVGRTCVKYLRLSRLSSPVPNAGSLTTKRLRDRQGKAIGGPWLRAHRFEAAKLPNGHEDQATTHKCRACLVCISTVPHATK